ncbi:D-glycero-beta-D-manno-heptose 1-phosphate adenylyltransferase [Chitinophagaceae bacterium LB-8]|uniref:D-glycero-beta-D-manno-heptose 1-phosphate adenylyltransferase n=1 Tax=Paraflavisolibacter caeni TaxID=2982496 RepID=A0A9X3BGE4_9BACT|nr:D-glycero-beta-D-manno-heptose 1-phosphate adenylyltransferase [Paraflavisolibacter caeni]MCU7550749.1 D-glycero-beta-D-manno-heptose 1-phosphate adenylyltransferase [Paraflavisolibacter caeni]
MRTGNTIFHKILSPQELQRKLAQWRTAGKTISFTNGCFDILHEGHIASLSEAAKHADLLIIGLNADASVKRLKGDARPINNENSRALILASLSMVDAVVIFSEDTPRDLIVNIKPDFLVKGGDYKVEDIAGANEVLEAGGKVIINPIIEGFSTTGIIKKLQDPC